MADPKLTAASVTVCYTSDDGRRSEALYKNTTKQKPEAALLEGLEEVARLLALFGFETEAVRAFNGALQRVHDWKVAREKEKGGA